jgi:hypothetical protein
MGFVLFAFLLTFFGIYNRLYQCGFLPFLRKYLMECIDIGYPEAPLEQEAIRMAEKICRE